MEHNSYQKFWYNNDMPRIVELVERFLQDYPPGSRKAYKIVVERWIEHQRESAWLMKERAITHPRSADARGYINSLARRQGIADAWGNDRTAATTMQNRKSILKTFYKFLISAGVSEYPNPFDFRLKLQAAPKRTYGRISDDDVRAMLMQPNLATREGRRDYAMLCLLFGLGWRRGEVIGIAISDLTTIGGITRIALRKQKNKKLSVSPLPGWAAEAVLAVLTDRLESQPDTSGPLFVKYGGPFSRRNPGIGEQIVNRIFREYAKKAGIKGWVSPHWARATAITKLLEEGHSHREVQEFSRHSSIQMVELYDKRRYELTDHLALKMDYRLNNKNS